MPRTPLQPIYSVDYNVLLTEFKAGAVVAIAGFCQAFIYGLLAFSPLGAEGISYAIYAGLGSAVLGGLVGVLLGKAPAQFGGPRGSTSFITAGSVALLLSTAGVSDMADPVQFHALMLLMGAQLGLTGLLIYLAQIQGLGRAMQFIPAPVLIGLNTMVGFFTFYSLIPALLGLAVYNKPVELFGHFDQVSIPALLVSLCVGAGMLYFRLVKPSPLSTLYGLVVGGSVYVLLSSMGLGDSLGPKASATPMYPLASLISSPESHWQAVGQLMQSLLINNPKLLIQIGLASLIAASIVLIESMCAHLLADQQLEYRHDTARELNVLALSNLLAGVMLVLPISNFSNRTSAGLAMGSRSRLSDGTYALAIVLTTMALWPVWGHIPILLVAAISGISSLVSIQGSTYRLFLRQITGMVRPSDQLAPSESFTFWVIVAMLTAAGAFNLLGGVLTGVIFVAVYFLRQQTGSGLSEIVHNPSVRSRTQRPPGDLAILNQEFQYFSWIRFEGNLFFANSPQINMRLQDELYQKQLVLLDFTRLRYIDDTGVENLARLLRWFKQHGIQSKVVLPAKPSETGGFTPFLQVIKQARVACYPQPEEAFWAIENQLLQQQKDNDPKPPEQLEPADPSANLDIQAILGNHPAWKQLPADQLGYFAHNWAAINLDAHQTLFEKGQEADGLYLLVEGQLSAWLETPGHTERLMRFKPGSLVGEMALLDGQSRSASIRADSSSRLLHLSQSAFESLSEHCPAASQSLLQHIAVSMVARLRQSNQTLLLSNNS